MSEIDADSFLEKIEIGNQQIEHKTRPLLPSTAVALGDLNHSRTERGFLTKKVAKQLEDRIKQYVDDRIDYRMKEQTGDLQPQIDGRRASSTGSLPIARREAQARVNEAQARVNEAQARVNEAQAWVNEAHARVNEALIARIETTAIQASLNNGVAKKKQFWKRLKFRAGGTQQPSSIMNPSTSTVDNPTTSDD